MRVTSLHLLLPLRLEFQQRLVWLGHAALNRLAVFVLRCSTVAALLLPFGMTAIYRLIRQPGARLLLVVLQTRKVAIARVVAAGVSILPNWSGYRKRWPCIAASIISRALNVIRAHLKFLRFPICVDDGRGHLLPSEWLGWVMPSFFETHFLLGRVSLHR